jgi:hypothetical protein
MSDQLDIFGAVGTTRQSSQKQFEIFWSSYPRRVSKGKAREAFVTAIKKTTLEAMLKAITEYVAKKPEKIDFKHPATWLNGECWDDEWEPPQAKAPQQTVNTAHLQRFQSREEYIRAERERSERSFTR